MERQWCLNAAGDYVGYAVPDKRRRVWVPYGMYNNDETERLEPVDTLSEAFAAIRQWSSCTAEVFSLLWDDVKVLINDHITVMHGQGLQFHGQPWTTGHGIYWIESSWSAEEDRRVYIIGGLRGGVLVHYPWHGRTKIMTFADEQDASAKFKEIVES